MTNALEYKPEYIESLAEAICPNAVRPDSGYIPGLDAHLCRCQACTSQAKDGVWHVSPERQGYFDRRKAERKRATAGLGDVAIEDSNDKKYIGKRAVKQGVEAPPPERNFQKELFDIMKS